MANYLLTGAAGFIASRVGELLLDVGHTVVGVDNLNDAYDVRLKEYRLGRLQGREGFSFHRFNIADKNAVFALVDNSAPFDAIINLAARAGVRASLLDPWEYLATNTVGTLNLLEFALHQRIKKFLLASSSSVYGANAPLPTFETADSSRPLQPYAASKMGAEAMCHAYHFLHGIDITIVRYFTAYGPAGRPDMAMFRFCKWIVEGEKIRLNGDGTQSRGFTYVDDIARGTIQGLKPVGFEVANLGGHDSTTMRDLIGIFEKKTGKKAIVEEHPFHKADMKSNLANVAKAGELLGWKPRVSLDEGISRLVQWYHENRDWAKDIETD